MSAKPSTHKVRRNRYKQTRKTHKPGIGPWPQRAATIIKCLGVIALLVGLSVALATAYAAITSANYFRARTIAVTGNQHLSRDQILDQAGIHAGDNILAVNLGAVSKRLLSHPWITSAQVSRRIPDAIAITVTEHHPLALLDLGQGMLIDDQGQIFKAHGAGDPDDLPTISGLDYEDLHLVGEPMSETLQTVLAVLRLCRSGQAVAPYEAIAAVHLDKQTGVALTLKDDQMVVQLGFDQFEKKSQRIKKVLAYLESKPQWRHIGILDAHNPDRVVVQPGKAAAKAKES